MNTVTCFARWLLVAMLAWNVAPTSRGAEAAAADTTLAEYVAKPDSSFGWKVRRSGEAPVGKWVELTLTSQTWHDTAWKHQLFVLKPNKVRDGSRALLVIAGSNWKPEYDEPTQGDADIPGQALTYAAVANNLGTPLAVLLQVPHQPLFENLHEDALISYTFEQYFKTETPTWPLLLPMVKSTTAAMTAVQQYGKQQWELDVKHFTLTGGSKRGWTTWLTSAVDPRVTALAPAVIDTLNMGPQMAHAIASWGKPSEQIHDYTDRGLHLALATERGRRLLGIVDPYSYRAQLTQPKFIILGTNDRYWPLDALNLYWSDLPGKKYVMYVPNQGHGIRDIERLIGSLTAFHRSAAGELQLAELEWKFIEEPGKVRLRVTSSVAPKHVNAWLADAPTRDFRDAKWSSQPMQSAGSDGHEFVLPLESKRHQAMFGEAVFATDQAPYYLSTNVKIFVPPASESKASDER
jgi:PhoPQ-activated pathogenicity-related protein